MYSVWFSRRSKHPAPARPPLRRRARLDVEALEDRMVMSTFSVVAAGAADNVTKFGTLHDLLNQANVQSGDVIQIEPGSSPGHIVDADIPNLTNLTIQGDPATDLLSIPSFFLDDAVSIDSTRQGFTFRHLQFDITGGTLQLLANSTISDCHVKVDFAGEAIEVDGPTAAVISDSYFETDNPQSSQADLLRVASPGNSHNRITDNQFVAFTGTDITLLNYAGAGAGSDLVADNTFNGNTGSSPLLQDTGPNNGLTIQGNTFTDGDPLGTAIEVVPDVQNLRIVDNVISLPLGNSTSTGIVVTAGNSLTGSNMVIAGNHISTGGEGTGIELSGQSPGVTFAARVEDNDLHGNGVGIYIAAGNDGSVTGIDLGGGTQGSLGANNFRGDTFAITTTASAGPIQAQMNIFGVTDPATVIYDHKNNPTLAAVVATSPLTGNAAYVDTLYLDFLHRSGDVTNPLDAGGWVTLLTQGTPATAVANAIAHSQEALGVAVDGLYHRFLGRDSDPAGRAGFVGWLQSGATLEAVIDAMLASPEYQSHCNADADFVQSLYQDLLHRTGDFSEITGWLAQLPQLGRSGLAQDFLSSPEYRAWEVGDDYAQLLHRSQPPSAAEVNGWASSGLDILTIDAFIAASPEFQTNG
jgi:hypothetical protein